MEEIKTAFLNYIQSSGLLMVFFKSTIKCLLISFGSLAIVYVVGRYLERVKTTKAKNIIGLIVMVILAVLVEIRFEYMWIFDKGAKLNVKEIFIFIFSIFFYWATSVIVYMTFCWKFYDRIQNAIESKFPSRVTRKKNSKK